MQAAKTHYEKAVNLPKGQRARESRKSAEGAEGNSIKEKGQFYRGAEGVVGKLACGSCAPPYQSNTPMLRLALVSQSLSLWKYSSFDSSLCDRFRILRVTPASWPTSTLNF